MTLQAKSFGSKCKLSEKFIAAVSQCGGRCGGCVVVGVITARSVCGSCSLLMFVTVYVVYWCL